MPNVSCIYQDLTLRSITNMPKAGVIITSKIREIIFFLWKPSLKRCAHMLVNNGVTKKYHRVLDTTHVLPIPLLLPHHLQLKPFHIYLFN